MAWGSWSSKVSSAKDDGSCYILYYRTNPYSSEGKAQIEYYVQVHNTGEDYSQRWNCKVELTVDGTTTTGRSHTVDYVGTSTNANKYSTTDKSGYYKGWKCISNTVLTKNASSSASWTISLTGGFRMITDTSCKIASFTVSANTYTAVGTGTVSIKDNGNNTFTVSGTKGTDGTNNKATGPTVSWGYNTNYNDGSSGTYGLTIATSGNATRRVYARISWGYILFNI